MKRGRPGIALAKQRHVNAHKVCAAQRFLKGHVASGALFGGEAVAESQVEFALNLGDEIVCLEGGIVAEEVDVKGHCLLHKSLADAPRANHGHCFAGYFVTEEWQEWMPRAPAMLPDQLFTGIELARHATKNKQRKLRRGFREDIGSMSEGNLKPVGVGAIDVVKPHGILRHHFQLSAPRFEYFRVNLVAQSGDEAINA